jgi:hypothetical protein
MDLPRPPLNPHPRLSPVRIRALTWIVGLGALIYATVVWALPATPYEAPWAWLSFIGMCIVDDFLLGASREAQVGQLPKVTLLAAVIVFRRHPELAVLVAGTAATLSSLLKGMSWKTWLTVTSQWLLAAVVGATAFRLVGFGDTTHFVAATIVLMAVYFASGPLLTAWLDSKLGGQPFPTAFAGQRRLVLPFEIAGVLLALAWRTGSLQPAALKVADAALVAVAGIAAGVILGRAGWIFRISTRIPYRPALFAGAVLLLSQLAPLPFSWLVPLLLALAGGIWAVWRRVFPVACAALGAYSNELVRAANGGHMPVEGYRRMLEGFGVPSDTYTAAGAATNFAWLDDRFQLPPPFPGIASVGDILIALGMAWLVAALVARRRAGPVSDAAGDALDAPPSDASAA